MTKKNLRAGVIGLGVGEQHAVEYYRTDGVELVAVADTNSERARRVAERFGLTRHYGDWRQLVDDPEIDVVSICSYDDGHAEQTIRALRAGKHVMVEKPATLTPRETDDVLRAIQDTGQLITSNLILRRSPRFISLQEQVRAGEYGRVFHIEGDYLHHIRWKITEGWRGAIPHYCTVFGGGVHLIDLMRWILDDEVEEVMAVGTDIPTQNSDYGRPDTITAVFKYRKGATGKTTTTFAPQRTKFHALNVYGTEKTFVNDLPGAKIFSGDQNADEVADTTPYPGISKGDLLPHFIQAIHEGRKAPINEIDIFRVMDVCFAVAESVETHKAVRVRYSV